jgi:hypothetical protein
VTKRIVLALVAVGAIGAGLAAAYADMPSCRDKDALSALAAKIRLDRHLEGVFIADIDTLQGWLFSARSCQALFTQITNTTDIMTRTWTRFDYSVPLSDPAYTVTGSATPRVNDDPDK